MKKTLFKIFPILIVLTFTILFFVKSEKLPIITIYSIKIFINNIFPTLFPMFIISNLLIELNFPYYLGKLFKRIFYILFKAPPLASFIFFMSMFTGFPSSSKYLEDLRKKDLITDLDIEKTLMFTFFSNPLFIIGMIGGILFKNKKIGLYIFISHLLGNILTGIIFRNHKVNKNTNYMSYIKTSKNNNLLQVLENSITNSSLVLMNVFFFFYFFLLIISSLFSLDNIFSVFLAGIFEMTTGLKYLSNLDISLYIKIYLSVFFISFGGLSVHFQIFSILNKRKIKYLPFLISRIIHSVISVIIIYIIILLDKLF